MPKKSLSILIAPDKFKGSLGASNVAQAIGEGIVSKYAEAHISTQPMADGGDGSIDLLNELWGLESHFLEVSDPLFRPVWASYYTGRNSAFIEMAKASGLALLEPHERNCREATSLGTGELILDAIQKDFKHINLFIGGSASNDAATGIASALGYSFLDNNGKVLLPIGENLNKIYQIKANEQVGAIQALDINIVCDVNNPFFGSNGAAHVYAAQKGADAEDILYLDKGLRHMEALLETSGFGSVQNLAGAGAAGGVGGGMAALFGANLKAGIDLFIDLFDMEEKVQQADIVITGEGGLDSQSFQGKVVGGMLKLCQKYRKPLLVVCGQQQLQGVAYDQDTIVAIHSIMDHAPSVEAAMNLTSSYLRQIGGKLGDWLQTM